MRVVFVGRDRVVWKRLLAYFLTLGVSRRVWLYRTGKEIDGHEALGMDHRLAAFLLCLPIGGPAWVTWRNAKATSEMIPPAPIRYGHPLVVAIPAFVPILGSAWFIAWQQSRLNLFWAHEREHPERGVEVDVDLASDPRFVVELGAALRESYHPGSRFDRRRKARRERLRRMGERWAEVQARRQAVRAAGGSTPLLPWRAPQRPEVRLLHVTCGRCATAFDVRRDPATDTPVLCPKCGLAEVLPALHQEPRGKPVPAAVVAVQAKCPGCGARFHAVRTLEAASRIACPQCGRGDVLPPAPAAPAGSALAGSAAPQAKAGRPRRTAAKA